MLNGINTPIFWPHSSSFLLEYFLIRAYFKIPFSLNSHDSSIDNLDFSNSVCTDSPCMQVIHTNPSSATVKVAISIKLLSDSLVPRK